MRYSRTLGTGWKQIENNGFTASILSFDEPSMYGINDGRISKLCIQKGKKTICNYDHGWDVQPSDECISFYNEIISKYN